jgi:hypothetical protein
MSKRRDLRKKKLRIRDRWRCGNRRNWLNRNK